MGEAFFGDSDTLARGMVWGGVAVLEFRWAVSWTGPPPTQVGHLQAEERRGRAEVWAAERRETAEALLARQRTRRGRAWRAGKGWPYAINHIRARAHMTKARAGRQACVNVWNVRIPTPDTKEFDVIYPTFRRTNAAIRSSLTPSLELQAAEEEDRWRLAYTSRVQRRALDDWMQSVVRERQVQPPPPTPPRR